MYNAEKKLLIFIAQMLLVTEGSNNCVLSDGSPFWWISCSVCICGHNHFAHKEGFYFHEFQLFFIDRIWSRSQLPKHKTAEISCLTAATYICKHKFLNLIKIFYFYYFVNSSHTFFSETTGFI